MKKRIVFVHEQMNVGGVESALLAVLRMLDKQKCDITLMLCWMGGPLFEEIPSGIKVMRVPFKPCCAYRMDHGVWRGMLHALCTCRFIYVARLLWCQLSWRWLFKRCGLGFNHVESGLIAKMVDKKSLPAADYAFAYTGGFLVGKLVAENFANAITGLWFHNEGSLKIAKYYAKFVKRFSHVFGCSESMRAAFNLAFRPYNILVTTMPHFVDFDLYRRRADEAAGHLPEERGFRILTVGRLCEQKGIDYIVEAVRKLLDSGEIVFRWYVVGGGAAREEYAELAKEKRVSETVIFLGEDRNPFGYYRDCDLYVQPSRYEAYCLAVAEARAFAKPIVVSDFCGSREQIASGETGEIVPVGDVDALTSAVGRLIKDGNLRERYGSNIRRETNSMNDKAKKAWDMLLNDEV